MHWINKDTDIYCSFAKTAGNTGCQMMNTAFRYYGLNKIYKSFSVDNIRDAVKSVETLNIKGFAVTMPFKQEILEYVDEVCESARIGAANTVINENNTLKAYNTDYLAALYYLKSFKRHYDFYLRDFYVLGNGGYALAVKAAAQMLDINYFNITRKNWELLNNIENSVIYNCTPVRDVESMVRESNTVIDCIVQTDTGYKLATIQASYQFKLYTGLKFPLFNFWDTDE